MNFSSPVSQDSKIFLGGWGGGAGGERRGSFPQTSLELAPPVAKIGLTAEKG